MYLEKDKQPTRLHLSEPEPAGPVYVITVTDGREYKIFRDAT